MILILALAAYLMGSVPFAILSSRLFGLADPRSYGSGNPGATNVLRSGNKAAALFTLIGDGAKGWFAVWLVQYLVPNYGLDAQAIAVVAFCVFLGHLYPLFLGFKGGKGVATAAGVLLALHPLLGLATLAIWLVVAFTLRYSSLAAITAAGLSPLVSLIWFAPLPIPAAITGLAVLLIWRHKENIARLKAGTESRIGKKKAG